MRPYLAILLLSSCSNPVRTAPEVAPEPVVTAEPAPEPEPDTEAPLAEMPIEVPADAGALSGLLTQLESTLRDPEKTGEAIESYGHLQQRIYRVLSKDETKAAAVRAGLPESLHATFDANMSGTARSSHTVTRRRSDLPDWDIIAPPEPEVLIELYRAAGEEFDVPWTVLAAIHLVETRMGRIRGTSHAGAQGPMQFMPATWAAYGEGDINDFGDAIRGAGRYLSQMGASRDLDKSIWHYNHSEDYIRAVRAFASVMDEDPMAYRGYWGWQVYYQTTAGDIWLAKGYSATERRAIDDYCGTVDHCPPQ